MASRASLPPGDGANGLIAIAACVRNFENATEHSDEEFRQRERLLAGNAEEISKFCDPGRNPTSFHNCQEAAGGALAGLVALALRGERMESRVTAYLALVRSIFNFSENAATVASLEQCVEAFKFSLRPITEMLQQQEHIAALHLVQSLAATVPEAPCISVLLPIVAELAVEGQEGYPACRAARTLCLEVLVSCALTSSRRRQVAKLLPARALDALVADADADAEARSMPMNLLFAGLCDSVLHDDQGPTEITIGEYGGDFWERTGFFVSFAACIGAAQRGEEWPPASGTFHRTWKLAGVCRQLALGGHAAKLVACAPPLIALVEQRASCTVLGADDMLASRLAVVALQALCGSEAAAVMRASLALPEALRQLEAEEEAARHVLAFIETGVMPPEGGEPAA